MPLRAVLWDFDDTLVPVHTLERWQWAWKPQGPRLNERHVRAALREGLRRWDRRRWEGLVGELPAADASAYHEALREILFAIAGRSLPEAESEAVLARFPRFPGPLEPYADVHPCLEWMRSQGVRMGVLVGPTSPRATELLGQMHLSELLPVVLGEGPDDPHTPAPAAYKAACVRLDTVPSETAFVGDLFWSDTRAAGRAGLHGILLDRNDWWSRVESVRVRTLSELPEAWARPSVDAGDAHIPPEGPAGPA